MASAESTVRTKRREPIDLSGAHIPGTSLSNADLARSNFFDANVSQVNFEGSNLREADFRQANLTGAKFTGADLTGADLSFAKLEGAVLAGTTLDEADLSHARISDALIEGLDLSKTKGLEWRQFLESRFDGATVLPDYLVEEDLFVILESAVPSQPWRGEFAGRIKDLLAELARLQSSLGDSLLVSLMRMQAELDLEEKDAGRHDE